jgi:hypothetical protein
VLVLALMLVPMLKRMLGLGLRLLLGLVLLVLVLCQWCCRY